MVGCYWLDLLIYLAPDWYIFKPPPALSLVFEKSFLHSEHTNSKNGRLLLARFILIYLAPDFHATPSLLSFEVLFRFFLTEVHKTS